MHWVWHKFSATFVSTSRQSRVARQSLSNLIQQSNLKEMLIQTSNYRAKVELNWSIESDTTIARRLDWALAITWQTLATAKMTGVVPTTLSTYPEPCTSQNATVLKLNVIAACATVSRSSRFTEQLGKTFPRTSPLSMNTICIIMNFGGPTNGKFYYMWQLVSIN